MHRYDAPRRVLALGMALLAGFVDAEGFLSANGYFVSFMSGNTTRLGVDLAEGSATALIPAGLIGGFLAGVTAGALVADSAVRYRKSAVLGLSTLLLAAAAIARASQSEFLFLAGCVLAMGVLNNAFRQNGEVAVGVTYMTGAIVRFGQALASWIRGRRQAGWLANVGLWASLATGAVAGATAHTRMAGGAEWIAVALALILFLGALITESRGRAGPG